MSNYSSRKTVAVFLTPPTCSSLCLDELCLPQWPMLPPRIAAKHCRTETLHISISRLFLGSCERHPGHTYTRAHTLTFKLEGVSQRRRYIFLLWQIIFIQAPGEDLKGKKGSSNLSLVFLFFLFFFFFLKKKNNRYIDPLSDDGRR